jgi:hypothetical protein
MEATRRRPVWAVCAAVVVAAAVLSLLWTDTASTQPFGSQGWRCYPAKQPKGFPKFVPVDIALNGTLQGTTAQALKPVLFCDPVNGPVTNSTERVGLVCYSIKDAKGTPKFPGATVGVNSDLFGGALAVKKSKIFCAPAFLLSVGP